MNFIFGIINLGILIAIGKYTYKKYLKSSLDSAIKSDQEKLQDLKIEAGSLENRVKSAVVDLVVQEGITKDLLKKVKIWQKAYNLQREDKVERIVKLQEKIDINNEIKANNLSLEIARRNLATVALHKARTILKNDFKDSKRAQIYLGQSLNRLREGASK